uniref:Sulfurtransferase n=1 Tax=Sinocyclocheilus anshuiensis TaxID=1608454 RepID=A0A671K5J0_9TELE
QYRLTLLKGSVRETWLLGNNTHVVLYDASDFGSFSAPRVWWMFRVFGHTSVSVLDGGFKNWLTEGHPVIYQKCKSAIGLFLFISDTEPGHIPGSINMPFPSFLDSTSGLERPVEELKKLFQQAGVDMQKPFWVTCCSGVTACHIALAAHLCGHPGVCLYDGAWAEWFTRAKCDLYYYKF